VLTGQSKYLLGALRVWAAACGSSDPVADARPAADSAAVDRGAKAERTVPLDGGLAGEGIAGKSVEVIYLGKSHVVGLNQPKPVMSNGVAYARLSDLVAIALPGKDQTTFGVDFESSDGFKPTNSPNCTTLIPMPGANLAKGYVQVESRLLAWDEDLGYPGCMSPKDVAKILLADK